MGLGRYFNNKKNRLFWTDFEKKQDLGAIIVFAIYMYAVPDKLWCLELIVRETLIFRIIFQEVGEGV